MPDGDYKTTAEDGAITTGKFTKHQMTGEWKRVDAKGTVLGSGTFKNGSGTWTSFSADGNKLASGEFDASRAEGDWKIFYANGKVAAQGPMHKGRRNGSWTFFYDDGKTKLSAGKFDKGETIGPWKHYGPDGKLVATASGKPWAHLMLSVEPVGGVRHEVDQGYPADPYRVDAFFLGDDRLYIRDRARLYDGESNALDKVDGSWVARACRWPKTRVRAAKSGDTAAMFASFTSEHELASDEKEDGECTGDPKPVAKAKAERLDKMLASRAQVHAPIPANAFHVATDSDNQHYEDDDASPLAGRDNDSDFATYLADHQTWYIEYPHVDDPFTALYASLPGHKTVQDEFPN